MRISFNKKYCLSVILIAFAALFINLSISASTSYQVKQSQDTSLQSLSKQLNYNSDFMQFAEVEHQKLLRNIFGVSALFVLALLAFTMYFYGSKIKKVSNIIVMQDDVLKATKDQLIKIISVFNYIDQQVYITDSTGIVEWANNYACNYFTEKYEENKISLVQKFSSENQGMILKGINDGLQITFKDNLYAQLGQWKMIPIKNSKGDFTNMIFIA
jgi:hypothetical protein